MTTILDDLRELELLLRSNGERKHATWVAAVAKLHGADPTALARALDVRDLWGGAGSIADQFLVPREHESSSTVEARARFYRLMVSIARHMQAHGVINARAENWASAFHQWSSPL